MTETCEAIPSRTVRSWIRGSLAALAPCLIAGALGAAEISYEMPEIGPGPALEIEGGAVVLDLESAVAIALERNLGLIVERQTRAETGFRVFEALGIYDLNLTGSSSLVDERSPSASNLDGADVSTFENQTLDLGLSRLLTTGGTLSLDWNNRRQETNSTFATLNPSYRVDFDLSFRQPLLRNRGKLVTERNLLVARRNLDANREDYEAAVVRVIRLVETEYWNVVEAREQLEVSRESLALAEQLHEQNRIRVDVGTLAPLELVQSESGVATRKEEIIRAEATLGDAEDRLRQVLNFDQGDLWATPLELTSDADLTEIGTELEEAIEVALAERPELRAARQRNEIQLLDRDIALNQKKPQLDLFLQYGYNGVGGDVEERDFFTGELIRQLPGGYSDALEQVTDTEFDGWVAQVDFSYPLQNRAAKARAAIAQIAVDRSELELRDLELGVITEVRRSYRAVAAAQQGVESARISRKLAEKTLDAEQKRYDNGLSTSFQLLEIQEDLTAARSREVSSETGYRRAVIDFHSAMGKLLDESGVQLVEPDTE